MSRQKPSIPSFKLVVIGDSGVGKTSFLNRYIFETYSEDHNSTIGAAFSTKIIKLKDEVTEVKLEMWDTAGRERYSSLARMAYRATRGLILCFDLTDRATFVRANRWLQEIEKSAPKNVRTLLVGCKVDLADRRQVSTEEAKEFAQHTGISYFETSAKLNIGIEEAMKTLVTEIEKVGLVDAPKIESSLSSSPTPVVASRWCNIL